MPRPALPTNACSRLASGPPPGAGGENRTTVVLIVVFSFVGLMLLVGVVIKAAKGGCNREAGVTRNYGDDAAQAYSNLK